MIAEQTAIDYCKIPLAWSLKSLNFPIYPVMQIPATFRQPGFLDLICDAAFHLELARASSDPYSQNKHARASIVAAIFSVESCSNCLLASLGLPKAFGDDLERLPTLSKIEVSLRMSSLEVRLDRSRNEVRMINELIQARNDFVHPKVAQIPVELGDWDETETEVRWPILMSPNAREATGIPKEALFWNADHAVTAFRAVTDFLAYLFDDVLRADLPKVQEILFHSTEAKLGDTVIKIESHFGEQQEQMLLAAKQGFNLAFLGFASK